MAKKNIFTASSRIIAYFARLCAVSAVLSLFALAYLSGGADGNAPFELLIKSQFSAALCGKGLFGPAAAVFVLVSLLFGRLFCSLLCPLGITQGLFFRLRAYGRSRFIAPWRIRYAAALAAGLGAVLGIKPMVILADPISNFGRGMTAISSLMSGEATRLVVLLAAPFFLICAAAFLRGRRFCDWCPVGLSLGLLSSLAPLGMKIEDGCTSCGVCEKKCPVNCADSRGKKIETGRCVLCLSCVAACPGGHAKYGRLPTPGRREFLGFSGARAAAFLSGALYLAGSSVKFLFLKNPDGEGRLDDFRGWAGMSGGETNARRDDAPILPPGAGDAASYSSLCIGCQACAAACPVGILRQKRSPHPEMDYSGDFCQYNCVECGRVCPTNAIRRLSAEEKHRTRVALSNLTFEKCVVAVKGQSCGACAEVCPTRSLRMVPYAEPGISGLTRPVFDENYCIGCGACLVVCPAVPTAFSVIAVPFQALTAGMRPTDDAEDDLPPLPSADDFPF